MRQKAIFMRPFDYHDEPRNLLEPRTVALLSALHECRGRQEAYLDTMPAVFNALIESAKILSTGASNRIEGIFTSERRLVQIVREKAVPTSRAEEEIAGYRDVLATIHENHEYIDVTPGVLLQLHRDLYRYTPCSFAGKWKDCDNVIMEVDERGRRVERFKPLSAVETPQAVEDLCKSYNRAVSEGVHDPLLLIGMFVFDFVCIHPFSDGNGRLSRLLTLLLLYKHGYVVGKYVSIEGLVERSRGTYYDVLAASSVRWNRGENDYAPFVAYLLGVVLAASRDLEQRAEGISVAQTKSQRIEAVFDATLGKVTKADIVAACPDISLTTIERTLKSLLDAGSIQKIGAGRASAYVKRVER